MKVFRVPTSGRGDSGSAAIETVFWLTAIQLPVLLVSLGLVAAQLQLARAETVLRESARATVMQLETQTSDLSQSDVQSVFAGYLQELAVTSGINLAQSQWSANCIPSPNCEFLNFSYSAGVEPWQPKLNLLFSHSTVQP